MNRMKLNYVAQLCVITHPLTRWMQIIRRLQYTFYHGINGNELTILGHRNNSLPHARTTQPCSPTAVGVCCRLQSCLNKLDGVLIEQGWPTMLSRERNQYGAFRDATHWRGSLKAPLAWYHGCDNADMQRASKAQNAKSFFCCECDSER